MKSNAAARRQLGMNHWRSNTQKMQFIANVHHAAKTGKMVSAWVAIRTKSDSFFYFL
ncbi:MULTISPECIES: stationary-phase-induced ribosome-associated protein [unclassified Pseudocitrobacter]|uniref:stationary-phase-induced ribosome-associated protein n=1 Tax=unclassified Pseudocitrobacter TaxID=2638778 RepID=UPI0023E39FFE|nr:MULTISPECIES: stationary-phase-induced ribosome-associated protein [unclassified Pseudocitrobacter]MDF3827506.1 stationary-phase-induced ribosome-associated protein [Pseudocitrobacter sp. 2023EL-00150]MEC5375262.1 stationary-phase-induced ribosome-associated protein [Pseudocitrobacter sp. MW920760]